MEEKVGNLEKKISVIQGQSKTGVNLRSFPEDQLACSLECPERVLQIITNSLRYFRKNYVKGLDVAKVDVFCWTIIKDCFNKDTKIYLPGKKVNTYKLDDHLKY